MKQALDLLLKLLVVGGILAIWNALPIDATIKRFGLIAALIVVGALIIRWLMGVL